MNKITLFAFVFIIYCIIAIQSKSIYKRSASHNKRIARIQKRDDSYSDNLSDESYYYNDNDPANETYDYYLANETYDYYLANDTQSNETYDYYFLNSNNQSDEITDYDSGTK
jgi:hypothetical protein